MENSDILSDNDEAENLFVYKTITVDPGQQPLRVDKFLIDRIPQISRNKIQIACKANCLIINDSPVKPNYKVKPGDEIVLLISEEKEDLEIPFHQQLRNEYQYLKHKYQLQCIHKNNFQFFRMRPPNFPTIRLAQLINLVFQHQNLFVKLKI